MSKQCIVCGYINDDKQNYCDACGTPFPTGTDTPANSQNQPASQMEYTGTQAKITSYEQTIQEQVPTLSQAPNQPQQVYPQGQAGQPYPQGQTFQSYPQGQTTQMSPQGQSLGASPQGMAGQPYPQGQTFQPYPQGQTTHTSPQGQSLRTSPQGQAGQPYPQGQATQAYPQGQVQFQQGDFSQPYNPYQQPQPDSASKKRKKTLWIILGVIGGLILLLIVGIVILISLLQNQKNTPGTSGFNPSTHTQSGGNGQSAQFKRYNMDNHSYYYPDYDSADMSSEAYIHQTTEVTESIDNQTDIQEPSDNTETQGISSGTDTQTDILESGAKAFTDSDLLLMGVSDTTEALSLELNNTYFLSASDVCTVLSAFDGNVTDELNAGAKYSQITTGRGIPAGSELASYIDTYGIDHTSTIWIMMNGDTIDAYYYSEFAYPDFADEQTALVFGWYEVNGAWKRLSPDQLNNAICNDSYVDIPHVLIYYAYVNAELTIDSIQIDHISFSN